MRISALLSLAAVLLSGNALAQSINLLPEGQTLITLSVTERLKVEQDTLVASLRIERDNRDSQALQRDINAAMEEALALMQSAPEIATSTGYYAVYQFSNVPQGGRPDMLWRGSQTITLEGKDAPRILALAGELQERGFLMNSLNYQLSIEKEDEVRDSLMESAIARARANAERAGHALGKADIEIAVLDIDTALGYSGAPVMMARSLAMGDMAERASPVAGAAETEVSLTVRVQAVAK